MCFYRRFIIKPEFVQFDTNKVGGFAKFIKSRVLSKLSWTRNHDKISLR